jgi:ubiquinone/menaquinone biosynthesis C-methylase UbiE
MTGMSSQQHQSDPGILDRRTLWRDYRFLADRLTPGMSVLDVGCGTGAITKGIAEAVGTAGTVVGVDRDASHVQRARAHGTLHRNLRYEQVDATQLAFEASFDIVTAARTLQWIADVPGALRAMARAARPGGCLVLLDYNHAFNTWAPAPPADFAAFYAAFLAWRASNGWDNEVADRLPRLLRDAGLEQIRSVDQSVTSVKGEPDFDERTGLWIEVIDNLGPTMVAAGACEASLTDAARQSYDGWRRTDLQRHVLSMKGIEGRVPAPEA